MNGNQNVILKIYTELNHINMQIFASKSISFDMENHFISFEWSL